MTQEQINELRKLAQAATPGPWEAWPVGDYPPLFTISTESGLGLFTTTTEAENETEFAAVFQDEDAAYIAAANPAAILALIQQRDELLAEMRVIEDILNRETNTQDMGYELFRRTNFIRRAIETTERKS